MRKHLQSIAYYSSVIIIGVVFGFALQFAHAAWSEPTAAPTACPAGLPGCDAPINVGSSPQNKVGILGSISGGAYNAGGIRIGSSMLNSYSGNSWLYLGDANGNVFNGRGLAASWLYAADGAYAGILYDTNDTNYYVNPNNVSVLNSVRITSNAGDGRVLTSDALGNASWQAPSGGGNCHLEVYTVGGMWGTCPAGWQFIGSNNQGSNGAYCWPSPTGVALSNSNARGCGDSDVTTCGRVVCN